MQENDNLVVELTREDYTMITFLLNKEINEFKNSNLLGVQKYVDGCTNARARMMRYARKRFSN